MLTQCSSVEAFTAWSYVQAITFLQKVQVEATLVSFSHVISLEWIPAGSAVHHFETLNDLASLNIRVSRDLKPFRLMFFNHRQPQPRDIF